MSVVTSSTQFSIAAHGTLSLIVAFNGLPQIGGDMVGPVVAAPVPHGLNRSLNVSTTSIRFLHRNDDGLTSKTIYQYTVTNPNAFHVTFNVEYFLD